MAEPYPDGRMYAECWHPESPGLRVIVRPCWLRRLGVVRSEFATLGEMLRKDRDAAREQLAVVRAAQEEVAK